MGETIELPNARILIEERPGYLYMVEQGTLLTVEELRRYSVAMEQLSERTGLRRALIDSRSASTVDPPREVRDGMWKWLLSGRAFDQIAFVLHDEMHVARVNMTALSQRAGVKAFAAVHEAHRWLTGRQRSPSQVFAAPGATTPVPPPRAESATPLPERRTQTPPRPSQPPPPAFSSTRSSEISLPRPTSSGSTGRFPAQRSPSQPYFETPRRADVIPPVPPGTFDPDPDKDPKR